MFRFPPLTPLVRTCLTVFLVAYVGLLIANNWLGHGELVNLLALNTAVLWYGNAWQLVTYCLVQDPSPAGVMPFVVSSLFFWLVVAGYEQTFGRRKTMGVLLASLLGASGLAFVVGVFVPGVLYGFGPLTLGAFAAYAWAMHILGQEANFFGVMPMKPVTMIGLVLGLSLLSFLASRNVLSLVGDVGATLAGVLFTERMAKPPGTPRRRVKRRRSGAELRVLPGGKSDDGPRWLN